MKAEPILYARPTGPKLWEALRQLRQCGLSVTHVEGMGTGSLWNIGPLNKLGYYEVLRLAEKTGAPQVDPSMAPMCAWPDMPKDAFR